MVKLLAQEGILPTKLALDEKKEIEMLRDASCASLYDVEISTKIVEKYAKGGT